MFEEETMSCKACRRFLIVGILGLHSALVPIVSQAEPCSGITHTNWTSPVWEFDEFFDSGSGDPHVVTLAISEIANNTIVEVKSAGSWVRVTVTGIYSGVATRFTLGGSVHIAYSDAGCGEEVQPHH
jgi:hypothetical protein